MDTVLLNGLMDGCIGAIAPPSTLEPGEGHRAGYTCQTPPLSQGDRGC
ncbi:hypothetical protein NC974_20645 [Leptolyngbya sp. SLC-A1]